MNSAVSFGHCEASSTLFTESERPLVWCGQAASPSPPSSSSSPPCHSPPEPPHSLLKGHLFTIILPAPVIVFSLKVCCNYILIAQGDELRFSLWGKCLCSPHKISQPRNSSRGSVAVFCPDCINQRRLSERSQQLAKENVETSRWHLLIATPRDKISRHWFKRRGGQYLQYMDVHAISIYKRVAHPIWAGWTLE